MNVLLRFASNYYKQVTGSYGFNDISPGGPVEPIATSDRFGMIIAKEDSVFSFQNDAQRGIQTSSSYNLLKGDRLFGYFHLINVASGELQAYYGK